MDRARFYAGDRVSCGYSFNVIITGTVIELHRRSDGAPFLMVEFTSGARDGQREYLDASWQLGVGPLQDACERCGRQFRHALGEHACYRCEHLDELQAAQRAANPDRRSSSWELSQRRKRHVS
jgi:hypothetical protein